MYTLLFIAFRCVCCSITQTSFAVAIMDIKLIPHQKAAASLYATAFLNFYYSIISQWPVLSEPTRFIKPFSDKVFNDRLTVSLDTLILVTISSIVLSEIVFNACNTFFADFVSFTGSFTGSFLSCFGLFNGIVTVIIFCKKE